jgi:hypothetical protein
MLLSLCLAPSLGWSAMLMESLEADGELSRIYIEGDRARLEMPGDESYIVMDVAKRSMKVVSHQERSVMDLSELLQDKGNGGAQAKVPRVEGRSLSKGAGPKIAGFGTEEYEIQANGAYCGTVFLSAEAMKGTGFARFARMMETMDDFVEANVNAMLGTTAQAAGVDSPCESATEQQMTRLLATGVPLRVLDQNRQLESEVTLIDKRAKLPVDAFVTPADYQQTTPKQMMDESRVQLQEMQQQMEQMMNNLPPETREMMRRQMQQQ